MRPTGDFRHLWEDVGRCVHIAKRALRPQELKRPAHHARRVHGNERILLGSCVVQEAAHDAVQALELVRHSFGDFLIDAAAAQHLDVRPDGAEGIADFVGDAGGQPADAGQFLAAHELALRIEQALRHAVQALGERREVAGSGVGRAGSEVAVGNGVRSLHHPVERPQDQPADERAAVEDENGDFDGDEADDEDDTACGPHRQREQRRRHADQEGEGDEEGEVEEQLRAERGLGTCH